MRLLLDTHILLWAREGSPKLSTVGKRLIRDADEIFVSSATIWEMSVKCALGKLQLDWHRFFDGMTEMGIEELPIRWHHGSVVRNLPPHTKDPFDRMLVAQAISEPLILLTHDKALEAYGPLVHLV
jgi:PIN domain nuclease of toxin-antitoxin system